MEFQFWDFTYVYILVWCDLIAIIYLLLRQNGNYHKEVKQHWQMARKEYTQGEVHRKNMDKLAA